jgi:hypothetical protein
MSADGRSVSPPSLRRRNPDHDHTAAKCWVVRIEALALAFTEHQEGRIYFTARSRPPNSIPRYCAKTSKLRSVRRWHSVASPRGSPIVKPPTCHSRRGPLMRDCEKLSPRVWGVGLPNLCHG